MAIHSLPSADESTGDDIVAEINITPLADFFLLLLILFMEAPSVISTPRNYVDLPSSAVASQTPAGVTVTITAEDEVAIDGAVVAGDAIAPALKAALDKAKDKVVVLRGDRDVVLGRAVSILDMAQEAGATGIALATKPPGPGEK